MQSLHLAVPRFSRVYIVPADMNGLVAAATAYAYLCIRSHDDFPYKLKLLEGASQRVERAGENVEEEEEETRKDGRPDEREGMRYER